jgi:hypothetical protein
MIKNVIAMTANSFDFLFHDSSNARCDGMNFFDASF